MVDITKIRQQRIADAIIIKIDFPRFPDLIPYVTGERPEPEYHK